MKHLLAMLVVVLFGGLMHAAAQSPPQKIRIVPEGQAVRSSPAYAEVVLRRADVEADLESLLLDFTEEYPKVKADRFMLSRLQKQLDAMIVVKASDAGKLTLALGKLMVKKVEFETDLWALQQTLADGHPDVKRAKKKVEIFDKAIKEILG